MFSISFWTRWDTQGNIVFMKKPLTSFSDHANNSILFKNNYTAAKHEYKVNLRHNILTLKKIKKKECNVINS